MFWKLSVGLETIKCRESETRDKHLIFLLCVLGLQKFHLIPKQKQVFQTTLTAFSGYLLKASLERHNTIRIQLIKVVKTSVQEMELQSLAWVCWMFLIYCPS